MTSKIKVDQIENSNGSGDVAFTGTNGIKLDTIKSSNGTTGLTVDSSGRILQPAKPAFACHMDREVVADFSSMTTIPFNAIEFQQGGTNLVISGSGDTTGATFTAPITGAYQFNFVVNIYGADTSWNSVYLYIDNAQVNDKNGSASHNMTYRTLDNSGQGLTNGYQSLGGSHVISLNANQTVKPRILTSGESSSQLQMGSRFSGFLIG